MNYTGFNPYSPGFSIYLLLAKELDTCIVMLQSLFTWIFYLFTDNVLLTLSSEEASILIHLDFLSILTY